MRARSCLTGGLLTVSLLPPLALVAPAAAIAAPAHRAAAAAADPDGAAPARSAACRLPLPQGAQPVTLRPECFVPTVTNRWFPLRPGARWDYRETGPEGTAHELVVVTCQRKRILGIGAVVVRDRVTEGGRLTEDTLDWYAQDRSGAVWYLGEDTKAYAEDGTVSTEGSWQAGVAGAQPGVVMPARPRAGQHYRQEYLAGHAEDRARVLSRHGRVQVPAGSYRHVVVTEETTPLEPALVERKSYASGVGLVATDETRGVRSRLLRYERRDDC
jgi:hypothetical protein